MSFDVLEWSRISFVLSDTRRQNRERYDRFVLQELSGRVSSGQLLAIMGPTGERVKQ